MDRSIFLLNSYGLLRFLRRTGDVEKQVIVNLGTVAFAAELRARCVFDHPESRSVVDQASGCLIATFARLSRNTFHESYVLRFCPSFPSYSRWPIAVAKVR
jgi:hypothetical protein